jgi:hypothetical protein
MNDRYIPHGPVFPGPGCNHLHKVNQLHKVPHLHQKNPQLPIDPKPRYGTDITMTNGNPAPTNDRPRPRALFADEYIPSQR